MHRRDFLSASLATTALYGTGALPRLISSAEAGFAHVRRPVLASVMLAGGPDFRHLLPPAYAANPASYGNRFWRARSRSFGIGSSESAKLQHWNNAFYHRQSNGHSFGILKKAVWLKEMWDSGNVAIVNNIVGSESRDHSHSILVMDQGLRSSGPNDFNRSGWGGRLARAAGGNVVATMTTPRPFCYPPEGDDIYRIGSGNLISTPDTRSLDLYTPTGDPRWNERGKVARALRSYYKSLRTDMDRKSVFYTFVEHEKNVRRFGNEIKNRLKSVREPEQFKLLSHWDKSPMKNAGFGQQVSNLYDALAANDILDLSVASLEYGDWDSHDDQRQMIEPNFTDMFGRNRAFDTLWKFLPAQAKNNLVLVIYGEFGRQLVANGEGGTDHGRANSVLVIGNPVRGGVYGDMFPSREIARLNDPSPDINGQTHIDRLFGEMCDWVSSGSAATVFPDLSTSKRESGVNFSRILA